jgi:ABC-type transport system involved in Fe-S cluster assembly fused permease/ATPase subunit
MASKKQSVAAKKNIRKAANAAKKKQTIKHLPKRIRTALGKKGAAARRKTR